MPTLIVSLLAEEDFEEIWSFVAECDVEAADRLIDEISAGSITCWLTRRRAAPVTSCW